MSPSGVTWQERARVFDERADEYDGWFDESLLFAIELAALKELETPFAEPRLELGVGPGRFAQDLAVKVGLDPAFAPLALAKKRGVQVFRGVGEELPVLSASFGTIFLLFTFCFLVEPSRVLAECLRVLRPSGHLVIGLISAQSAWGEMLRQKSKEKHPFYRHAHFYRPQEVEELLVQTGFKLVERRSSLRQSPEALAEMEYSRPGLDTEAGFAVLVAEK